MSAVPSAAGVSLYRTFTVPGTVKGAEKAPAALSPVASLQIPYGAWHRKEVARR